MNKWARLGGAWLRSRTGVASIEFSLTVLAFVFMIFFIAEIARLTYISAVIDLAVSEAGKEAKNAPATKGSDYSSRFKSRLEQSGGTLWHFLTKADEVNITISYASSIADMVNRGGNTTTYVEQPIARYLLVYRYHPMFFPFPEYLTRSLLNREVIFVQEYERSQFLD